MLPLDYNCIIVVTKRWKGLIYIIFFAQVLIDVCLERNFIFIYFTEIWTCFITYNILLCFMHLLACFLQSVQRVLSCQVQISKNFSVKHVYKVLVGITFPILSIHISKYCWILSSCKLWVNYEELLYPSYPIVWIVNLISKYNLWQNKVWK